MFIRKAIEQFTVFYFSTCELSEKTYQAYTGDLVQFQMFLDKNIKLSSITPEIIEDWAYDLKDKKYKPATIQRKLTSLKVFFNYWARKKKISNSPFWKLKINFGNSQALPKVLTHNEVERLLQVARREFSAFDYEDISQVGFGFLALRNLAIVETMFSTGMRVGEIVALNIEDFNSSDRSFLISGKGNKQRMGFVIDDYNFNILECYYNKLQKILPKSKALFVNVFRHRISTQGVANVVAKLSKKALIEKHITPHMIRHTSATMFLQNGADIRVVQEFLGHSSITTTQRYTHISKEHLISQLESFHPALKVTRNIPC